MQCNLQAKAFGFHRCLIVEILNIFCIISYVGMIMVFLEQLIGSTRPYTVLTITLCNNLLEKNNLSQIACVVTLLDNKFSLSIYHQLDSRFFH